MMARDAYRLIWEVYKARLRAALYALIVASLVFGLIMPAVKFGFSPERLRAISGVFIFYVCPIFPAELIVSARWSIVFLFLVGFKLSSVSQTLRSICIFIPGLLVLLIIPPSVALDLPEFWENYTLGWPIYVIVYGQLLIAPVLFCYYAHRDELLIDNI